MNSQLELYDPTTDKTYTLLVSQEDFGRAINDLRFAQSLLQSAMSEESAELPCENEHSEDIHESSNDGSNSGAHHNNSDQETPSSDGNSCREDCNNREVEHLGRNIWSHNATVPLIHSMESHIDNLNHPTKKKNVFHNIANDLVSVGHEYNAVACQNKWKTLVRSYKTAKDHKKKTGRGPSRFHFFDLIDNILGDKPSNKCDHTLESSAIENDQKPKTESESDAGPSVSSLLKSSERKRKRTTEDEKFLQREERKNERHRERMELGKAKLAIEERKVHLLQMLLEKK